MTKKQRAYQISLLRMLHTAERYMQYFADDPIAYRAFLKKHLGVDSSKELSLTKLKELVEYMQMKNDTPPNNWASHQQIGYIRHLWQNKSETRNEIGLNKFASKILQRETTNIEYIRPNEASKLIYALKKMSPKTPNRPINNPYYRTD